jgi:TolB-like protein/DNA-binding winged helix-turn-helix (wHTH) protein/Tfp pilus assembly protein PilF
LHLARPELAVGTDFRIAAWLVQPRLNTVSNNGSTVRLEPKVMEVLVCLAQHAGEPVSKEELLQTVWSNTFVTDDVLKRSISELRRVFEDEVRDSRIIQTIPKRGYRLLVPVEPVNGGQSALPEPPGPESLKAGRNWRTLALISGGTALLFILLGAFYIFSRKGLFGKSSDPQIRSIAVLPLQNLSGDPSQEYLSDGMTDALITDLAQIGSLRVISRTSSMQYKQTTKSLPEIGRELSVDGIVEGSIHRSGDHVRITAQLIHGPSDRHLWANTYEGDFRNVFALERNVTQDITHQVQARIMPQNQTPQTQPRPTNPKALDAYLQGNYRLSRYGNGFGAEEMEKAGELFQQAIDADANFAPAYLGLARAHSELPLVSSADVAIRRKAEETALALDPNSPEAQTILANNKWGDLDWAGAEKEFRKAVELSPNYARAHDDFCELLSEMGRLDEAWKECQIAQELDPNNDHLAAILYKRGEYDHAIAILRLMIERHPDDGGLHYLLYECYVMKQDDRDAIKELERTLTLYGLLDAAARIRPVFAATGFRAAMLQWTKEMERLQAKNQFYMPVNLADAYAVLGENDRAFYWLDQAVQHRDMIAAGLPATWLGTDPMLESLHADLRFKDLLRGIGLPP